MQSYTCLLRSLLLAVTASVTMPRSEALSGEPQGRDYPITPVSLTAVELSDGFWSRRLEVNRNVTLRHNFKECESTGRIDNFVFAAGIKNGKYQGYPFNDSDVFKAIEGASYALLLRPDRSIEQYVDSVITIIAAAQEADGYLYTPRRLIREDYSPPGGKERWVGIKEGSHELYNLGHLYEAAAAHYRATGRKNLLDVAVKSAELICRTFGPGKRGEVPGHQEIEIGLCKLYRVTGDERYVRMAQWFLDQRGNAHGHELIGEYAQDHMPVRDQQEAVGHSVRAAYMYSGMADVAVLTGDTSYIRALDRIWNDVINTKLYVTGGIGASGGNEGFSHPYVLPNLTAYCETCASIALALWSQRMFLLHGDAAYIDVLEKTLYNSLLAGVGMSGDLFFYPNPLESTRGAERSPWFSCACCPPNVLRFLPSVGSSVYAVGGSDLYVNLFAAGKAKLALPHTTLHIRQETHYPWEGTIQLHVDPNKAGMFTIRLRIPGWAQERVVPGTLYHFLGRKDRTITLTVNGTPTVLKMEKGYAVVRRTWKKGDVLALTLPMEVRRVVAHDSLTEDRGRVALQRGPIVYCLEGVDMPGRRLTDIVLPDTARLTHEYRRDLLNGVEILHGSGFSVQRTDGGEIIQSGRKEFVAVPYYAWAHRGKSEMMVWLRNR
jgi:uncharacterized protein